MKRCISSCLRSDSMIRMDHKVRQQKSRALGTHDSGPRGINGSGGRWSDSKQKTSGHDAITPLNLPLSISLSPLSSYISLSIIFMRKLCSRGELKNLGLWNPICHDFVDVRTPICHETLSDTVASTEHVTLELWCLERLWSFRRLIFDLKYSYSGCWSHCYSRLPSTCCSQSTATATAVTVQVRFWHPIRAHHYLKYTRPWWASNR